MKFVLLNILFCTLLFADNLCVIEFSNGIKLLSVPLADTDEKRRKGLSNKDDIGNGMLFGWLGPQNVCFWMKDTKKTLNIGFFDKNRELFQIETMQPLSLELHCTDKESLFALELKEGGFKKDNITIGTKITKLKCK
ncbi:MAG: DUF192 domain-containing protein [Campylobacteraceae bacterium]|jgi:uncharacterized membrane protein (UPF0127 family)|nr:DUF192 domain-containing protein [Campylobacteraceae bacterium]